MDRLEKTFYILLITVAIALVLFIGAALAHGEEDIIFVDPGQFSTKSDDDIEIVLPETDEVAPITLSNYIAPAEGEPDYHDPDAEDYCYGGIHHRKGANCPESYYILLEVWKYYGEMYDAGEINWFQLHELSWYIFSQPKGCTEYEDVMAACEKFARKIGIGITETEKVYETKDTAKEEEPEEEYPEALSTGDCFTGGYNKLTYVSNGDGTHNKIWTHIEQVGNGKENIATREISNELKQCSLEYDGNKVSCPLCGYEATIEDFELNEYRFYGYSDAGNPQHEHVYTCNGSIMTEIEDCDGTCCTLCGHEDVAPVNTGRIYDDCASYYWQYISNGDGTHQKQYIREFLYQDISGEYIYYKDIKRDETVACPLEVDGNRIYCPWCGYEEYVNDVEIDEYHFYGYAEDGTPQHAHIYTCNGNWMAEIEDCDGVVCSKCGNADEVPVDGGY